jgi:hypothetical protein
MLRYIPFFLMFLVWSCSQTVEPTSSTKYSSEESSATGGSSSDGGGGSSSEADALDPDSDAPDGISDLEASRIVSENTVILKWTDLSNSGLVDSASINGYLVFRSVGYEDWETIAVVDVGVGFYRDTNFPMIDTTLGTYDYNYSYRVAPYDSLNDAGQYVLAAQYSNVAGVSAIDAMGFDDVIFETPNSLGITRFGPGTYSLSWSHSGRDPEMGFVVQTLTTNPDTVSVTSESGEVIEQYIDRGDWLSLDTLGEADNHFYVYGADPLAELFRVYAYYSPEFGRLISEYTNEVVTPIEYADHIEFTDGPTELRADLVNGSYNVDLSWTNSHNEGSYIILSISGLTRGESTQDIQIDNAFATSYTYTGAQDRTEACRIYISGVRVVWDDNSGIGTVSDTIYSVKSSDPPGCSEEVVEDVSSPVVTLNDVAASSAVNVNWTQVTGTSTAITHYQVERSLNYAEWETLAYTVYSSVNYLDTTLVYADRDLYRYRVVALNTPDSVDGSNTITVSPYSAAVSLTLASADESNDATVTLGAPANLEVARLYPSVFELTWDRVSNVNVTGYVVERLDVDTSIVSVSDNANLGDINIGSPDWEVIGTLGPSSSYFQAIEVHADGDSLQSTRQRYRVAALYGAQQSGYTDEVLAPSAFREDIIFEEPSDVHAYARVPWQTIDLGDQAQLDAVELGLAWVNTFVNIGYYTEEFDIQIEESKDFGTPVIYTLTDAQLPENNQSLYDLGTQGSQVENCTMEYRVRYRWKDIFGGIAYSPWSDFTGTRRDNQNDDNVKDYCGY